jgi:hypothetical protein
VKAVTLETGITVRVERNGRAENVDIGTLNPAELSDFFRTKEKHELLNWLVFLMGGLFGQALKIKALEKKGGEQ